MRFCEGIWAEICGQRRRQVPVKFCPSKNPIRVLQSL
jgi:hypothetical protein